MISTLDIAADAAKLQQFDVFDKCNNLKKSFGDAKENLGRASSRREQLTTLEDATNTLEELQQFVTSSNHVISASLQDSKCKDVCQLLVKFKVSPRI